MLSFHKQQTSTSQSTIDKAKTFQSIVLAAVVKSLFSNEQTLSSDRSSITNKNSVIILLLKYQPTNSVSRSLLGTKQSLLAEHC